MAGFRRVIQPVCGRSNLSVRYSDVMSWHLFSLLQSLLSSPRCSTTLSIVASLFLLRRSTAHRQSYLPKPDHVWNDTSSYLEQPYTRNGCA
ncbi:hypothetical protein L596_027194 [Steinernema carpocapsae]|uniref:Uncharacterized protein n=1 Tax=Steinernema carpocapsae TaxID=34508 RepID=A0A4U5M3K9_STECR|nr:hypothetical protein L596_027194 [Steinernema carpocapsae]